MKATQALVSAAEKLADSSRPFGRRVCATARNGAAPHLVALNQWERFQGRYHRRSGGHERVGLGGSQIFTVDQSDVRGPIKFMSLEWRELVRYALKEAERFHLKISMEGCDGWSESGGPWVTPEESMQKAVWTQRQVSGPQTVPLDLPQPETVRGYHHDIAAFAFPTPVGSRLTPAKITANDPGFDGGALLRSDPQGATLHFDNLEADQWVQYEYTEPEPEPVRSVEFAMTGEPGTPAWQVQTSQDGAHFSLSGVVSSGDHHPLLNLLSATTLFIPFLACWRWLAWNDLLPRAGRSFDSPGARSG